MELSEKFSYSKNLSNYIRTDYPEVYKKNACYCNVYNMILSVQEFAGRDLQVLFCYVPSQAGYFRHAFLICDNAIIEPLPLQWCKSGEADISQLVLIRCLKKREYMELVLCSREDAGLHEALLKQEVKAYKRSDIKLNVLEISYLAQRFSDTPDECVMKLNHLAVNDKTVLDENYKGKGIYKAAWYI